MLLSSAILVTALRSLACSDYSIDLPQGYQLVQTNADEVVISKPNQEIIVGPTIDGYSVVNLLVMGHTSIPRNPLNNPEAKSLSKPGYFLVNTSAHHVAQGLEKGAWLQLLRDNGIPREPILHAPSRFDGVLGYNR
jgi:hypothetical protein